MVLMLTHGLSSHCHDAVAAAAASSSFRYTVTLPEKHLSLFLKEIETRDVRLIIPHESWNFIPLK